jgi:hypothetical protein
LVYPGKSAQRLWTVLRNNAHGRGSVPVFERAERYATSPSYAVEGRRPPPGHLWVPYFLDGGTCIAVLPNTSLSCLTLPRICTTVRSKRQLSLILTAIVDRRMYRWRTSGAFR